MAAIRALQQLHELDARESDGITVTLLWNRTTGQLWVRVNDGQSGAYFELDADADTALDVFRHPYSYAAFRGVPCNTTLRRLPQHENSDLRLAA
jgi:hypothetical protein